MTRPKPVGRKDGSAAGAGPGAVSATPTPHRARLAGEMPPEGLPHGGMRLDLTLPDDTEHDQHVSLTAHWTAAVRALGSERAFSSGVMWANDNPWPCSVIAATISGMPYPCLTGAGKHLA